MTRTPQQRFGLPATWVELNTRATELLLVVTLLVGSVSLVAMASGEPEAVALVALTGIALVVLGTALVRLSEYLRTNGLTVRCR